MPTFDAPALLDALSAPLGDLIAAVGTSVASAQRDIDLATINNLQAIYESSEDLYRELQAIGYRPTWYHIPEAEAEISMALTVTGSYDESTGKSKLKTYSAPVDAGYSGRYNYDLKGASKLRFKVVPVPESPAAEAVQIMPNVVGLTYAQATSLLTLLRVSYTEVAGATSADEVTAQTPDAGSVLRDTATLSVS